MTSGGAQNEGCTVAEVTCMRNCAVLAPSALLYSRYCAAALLCSPRSPCGHSTLHTGCSFSLLHPPAVTQQSQSGHSTVTERSLNNHRAVTQHCTPAAAWFPPQLPSKPKTQSFVLLVSLQLPSKLEGVASIARSLSRVSLSPAPTLTSPLA